MKHLPTAGNEKGTRFTIGDFYEAGREQLELVLFAGGRHLDCEITEPIVNRPGLALTGFFKKFAWRRPQLIGEAEMAYLDSLSVKERLARFRSILDRKTRCFVFTAGGRPLAEEGRLADEAGAVIFTTKLRTRQFANQSTFLLERLGAPSTTMYGTMIEVAGLGVFIEGDPGLGKSETALGLIKRGHALIADDLTCIRKEVGSNVLFASASDSTAGFMEIRGIGIMHIPRIFGVTSVRGEKRLQLVITFKRLVDVRAEIDRVGQDRHFRRILGVDVPNIIIPVSEGRDLVNLVETAAMQQKLLQTGFDPVDALSQRLRLRADKTHGKTRGNNHG